MTTTTKTQALAAAIAGLDALDPIERARQAKALIVDAQRVLADLQREAVYQATRSQSYAEVAEALGVSPVAVNLAVTNHRKTLAAVDAELTEGATFIVKGNGMDFRYVIVKDMGHGAFKVRVEDGLLKGGRFRKLRQHTGTWERDRLAAQHARRVQD